MFTLHIPELNHIGRRRELIAAAILYALGGLITASAPELNVLLVGRLLYGLGIGLVSFLQTYLIVADIRIYSLITKV